MAANPTRRARVLAGMPVTIVSIGTGIPEKILSNADLEKMVNTSDEWIRERTGMGHRRLEQRPAIRRGRRPRSPYPSGNRHGQPRTAFY